MKSVKFHKGWNKYNAGETAGFEDDQADVLVKAGIAVLGGAISVGPDTAVTQAMADVQRLAQREHVRLAQIATEQDGRAEALAQREDDLAAREAAFAARLAEVEAAVAAEPPAPEGEDATSKADAGEDVGGLPKQGRK